MTRLPDGLPWADVSVPVAADRCCSGFAVPVPAATSGNDSQGHLLMLPGPPGVPLSFAGCSV